MSPPLRIPATFLLALLLTASLSAAPPAAVRTEVLRARLHRETPVVVFDLDDTLFVAGSRTRAILEHYAVVRRPDLLTRVRALDYLAMPYRLTDTLDRAGITEPTARRDMEAYWKARFFGNFWTVVDVPMPGGPAYVTALHAAGATLVYLTGRDEPGMGLGTRQSLRDSGFPVDGARVHFMLKPNFELADETFKADALSRIGALGRVVATFENEPGNAAHFLRAFPGAHHYLLGDRHRPDAPAPDPRLIRIERYPAR